MFHDTSGRKGFRALPPLTRYVQTVEECLQGGIHAGIVCNYGGKSEWKGASKVNIDLFSAFFHVDRVNNVHFNLLMHFYFLFVQI